MLYRCLISAVGDATETPVFFEASGFEPYLVLEHLLATIWQVDPRGLMVLNLVDEHTHLFRHAIGPATDGDVRLYEAGIDGGRPTYLDPAKCLAYVSPTMQARLAAAAQRLAVRRPGAVA